MRMKATVLVPMLALVGCSASNDEDDALACRDHAPPCPTECVTILGNPIAGDCWKPASVDLACAPQVTLNALTSCARDERTGVSYHLASDTYRQLLQEKSHWIDCDGNWLSMPSCP